MIKVLNVYEFVTLVALARWHARAHNCTEVRALLGQTNIKDVDMEAVRAGRSRAAEQFALAGQPSHKDLAGILLLSSTRLLRARRLHTPYWHPLSLLCLLVSVCQVWGS